MAKRIVPIAIALAIWYFATQMYVPVTVEVGVPSSPAAPFEPLGEEAVVYRSPFMLFWSPPQFRVVYFWVAEKVTATPHYYYNPYTGRIEVYYDIIANMKRVPAVDVTPCAVVDMPNVNISLTSFKMADGPYYVATYVAAVGREEGPAVVYYGAPPGQYVDPFWPFRAPSRTTLIVPTGDVSINRLYVGEGFRHPVWGVACASIQLGDRMYFICEGEAPKLDAVCIEGRCYVFTRATVWCPRVS